MKYFKKYMALDKMFTKSFNAMRELGEKKSARVQNLWKKKTSENRSMTASHCSN